ncbi:hypothetical protein MIR68_000254 [Amoeboaphelidium protococcarum]|nr:hypothetical protein MIR68_000254 [Amoeboaphelidium protococcarum]
MLDFIYFLYVLTITIVSITIKSASNLIIPVQSSKQISSTSAGRRNISLSNSSDNKYQPVKGSTQKYKKNIKDGNAVQTTPRSMKIGFFHPYCNAGGGGERVLWVALLACMKQYPNGDFIIFTGDLDASPEQILSKAKDRFNIELPLPVQFVFLKKRFLVEDKLYPRFTLLFQSLGSMVLGYEAIRNCGQLDIFIDTMGYAFVYPLVKTFCGCKIACYVHYPTISSDMLHAVESGQDTFNNRVIGFRRVFTAIKSVYYRIFALLYGCVGQYADCVMVNSSWTEAHIKSLWNVSDRLYKIYPPCNVQQLASIGGSSSNKADREKIIVSIGQFRPEKNHQLQLKAFARFLLKYPRLKNNVKLVLIGGCRNAGDHERVADLKRLSLQLDIDSHVEFVLNAPYEVLKDYLSRAMIGIHTMHNEHFGIGIVEYMAAGVIPIANASGGPLMDIVVKHNSQPTGFVEQDEDGYADFIAQILQMSKKDRQQIQQAGRLRAMEFDDDNFSTQFIDALSSLIN